MELKPKQKGNLTELQCITACYEAGYSVSIPYGENSRYDFILDLNGKLLKIQVKTSCPKKSIKESENAIYFSCRSVTVNSKGNTKRRYDKEQIDYFATFWDGKCYMIPVEECSTEKTLWFGVPANSQKKLISMACDYELSNILSKEASNQ